MISRSLNDECYDTIVLWLNSILGIEEGRTIEG